MKILVLNYEYPPLGGGAGVITQHISEGLAKLGNQVTVVTTWFEHLPETEEKDNLKIIRLKSKRKFTYQCSIFEMISWIRYSWSFLNLYLKENTFEICLANFALPGGIVGLHIKNKFKIPYTIISHGHDIPWFCKKEMFWYHLLLYPVIKQICKKSEINFIQTREMKTNIDRFIGEKFTKKNILVPNACDTKLFFPASRKKPSVFKIIFSGRLVKQKDPFTFLEALKILSKKDIPFITNIFGDGPLRKSMEKFVNENQLSEIIKFSGWISKQELAEEYRSSDIFVQTSIHEAMSIATMEAMASGTYIICTPVGMNKELILPGETGELVAFSEPEELAEKLSEYYFNKCLTGFVISKENSEKFHAEYDWELIVIKYDKYFKTIKILK